jgi:hypothetical protein
MGSTVAAKPVLRFHAANAISRTGNRSWNSTALTRAARREEICAKKKAWNKANQKYCQEYYRRNREKMLEYGRKYREVRKAQISQLVITKKIT